ncbi:MAG TPA: alpha/beta hydrolase [Candidatus Binataceae bacterium]|nr:alpha/beta hydrolase [Candidatus Binataceae bacterium]
MAPPKSFDLRVNGIRLRCQDWGGHGRPILLVHATGMMALLYAPIARALTSAGQVLSYDQRGHGDSDHPPDAAYDWEHQLADLHALIKALGLRELRGVGHSGGATILAALSAQEPALISRLVMVEPVLIGQPPAVENPLVQSTLRRRASFTDAAEMYRHFAGKPPYDSWQPELLRAYCEEGAAWDPQGRWRLKCPPEIESSFYRLELRFQTLRRVLGCRAPALVIFGTRGNRSTGAAHALTLKRALPQVEIVTMAEYGHLIAMENPDLIAQMALDFLARP